MGLSHLEDATATITVKQKNKPDADFTVRGLRGEDVTWLVRKYLPQIEIGLTTYLKRAARTGKTDPTDLIVQLVPAMPDLFAELISHVSGEDIAQVRKLRLGYHVMAVSKIVELTVEEVGDLGNIVAELAAAVQIALPGGVKEKLATLNKAQSEIDKILEG